MAKILALNVNAESSTPRAKGKARAKGAERWFVYIARCSDGTLYTGIALDVALRLAAHNSGRGARYTRGRGPLALCARRRCGSKRDALRLEWAVKRLPRPEKETLLGGRRLATFARRVVIESFRV